MNMFSRKELGQQILSELDPVQPEMSSEIAALKQLVDQLKG